MNKLIRLGFIGALLLSGAQALNAQSAMDAFQFAQPDMKGTARFMSMGGAFGALGADLTVLNQNPGGIGVYRSSEVGFTLDLDAQSSTALSQGLKTKCDQTKFYLNNIGGVITMRTNGVLKNFNIGFTYNKTASFNRRYKGAVPHLGNSLSNYIAGIANSNDITIADLTPTSSYDPYNPTDGGFVAPWITILGYDSKLIAPYQEATTEKTLWSGQWGSNTQGTGSFDVEEKGAMNEFNIALGGNFNNVFYWGMDFGIINFDYKQRSYWAEDLKNAYVDLGDGIGTYDSYWKLGNSYHVSGTGFNYKLGFIVKPVQEFRIGFAFHTPTWYSLSESYIGSVRYDYPGMSNIAYTNSGYTGESDFDFRTPWRLIASLAGVIGNRFILSADYEWANYANMKYSESDDNYYYDDYYDPWDPWFSPQRTDYFDPQNSDVKTYYKAQNTLRVGAEFRVTSGFSLRAGYSYVSSPVEKKAKDGEVPVYTAGTRCSYAFDNITNYITAGFGYRYRGFSIDMAYVFKHRSSEFHAYPSDIAASSLPSPTAKITSDNNQVILSMAYRF